MKKYIAWILLLAVLTMAGCHFANTEPTTTPPSPDASTAPPLTSPSTGVQKCSHERTHRLGERQATCGADGYSGNECCVDCGARLHTGAVIPATGEHSFTEWVAVSDSGNQERRCQICNLTQRKTAESQPTEPPFVDTTLPLPDEFPQDLLTDEATLSAFQEYFDANRWARQISGVWFTDPSRINLFTVFAGISMGEDIPVTDEDRAAIVAQSGNETYYTSKAYVLPIGEMDKVLQQYIGLAVSDLDSAAFTQLYYLQSSGNYCHFDRYTKPVTRTDVMGVRFMDDGNVEVYYVTIRPDYPEYYGVITMKIVDAGYRILSNIRIDVWPKPGHVPVIPDGAPADLNTDPDAVKQYQKLFDNDSWYTQALLREFNDPRYIELKDFLFCTGKPWPYENATPEEEEAVRKLLGITEIPDWWGDWYSMDLETINEVLQTVFGLTLADFPETELQYIHFLESTGRYYYGHSDSSLVWNISVAGIRELENGNVEVYYTQNNQSYAGGCVTLEILEDGYRVISNTKLSK
jgi:hypothetical protein